MKKTLITYISVLVVLFIIFSIWGIKGEYAVERKVWRLHKQYADILKDPNVIPDKTFEKVIKGYQRIIDQHPKSRLTQGIRFIIGRVYLLKKDYTTARTKFNEIVALYPDNQETQAQAHAAIGQSYELEKNWPEASKTYEQVLKNYAVTPTGLGIPIYLANHYKNMNDYQRTMEAYERAIIHYSNIASQNPDSFIEYNAWRYLANCYLEQKRWSEAISTLGKILEKYADAQHMNVQTADTIIKTINVVSSYQLKDYDAAITIYKNIISKKSDHPLSAYLQKMIDAFNQLKEKGVRLAPAAVK